MEKKLIIAHRGAHDSVPENTLAAFQAAIDCRADMAELDVRKSGDGFFLIHHDDSIQGNPINRIPFRDILRLGHDQGINIPLFQDVLAQTRNRIKLDIEIKESGDEKEIVELILKYFNRKDFVITSFRETPLAVIKKIDPRIRTGLIIGEKKTGNLFKRYHSDFFPFRKCLDAGIDIIVPHWKLLRFGFLQRARRFNLPVFVWTVNDRRKMRRLLGNRLISGIITDQPGMAVKMVQNLPNRKSW
jgi:glycerophosphoryl diester phosphodiesterase